MSDEEWQSFSNWCPGDVIDNRIIRLGAMKAGEHSVKISVPEAVFPEQQGDIPVSMFFQGASRKYWKWKYIPSPETAFTARSTTATSFHWQGWKKASICSTPISTTM